MGLSPRPYDCHPIAEIFPPIEGEEFAELCRSVEAHGVIERIITFQGQILDGRNRYRAWQEVGGPEPAFEAFDSDEFDPDPAKGEEEKALAYALAKNGPRRHLTPAQKAEVALAILDYEKQLARARQAQNLKRGKETPKVDEKPLVSPVPIGRQERERGESYARAGAKVGVSGNTVRRFETVKEKGTPELQQAVKAGQVGIETAARIAQKPASEQTRAVVAKIRQKTERRAGGKDDPEWFADTIQDEAGNPIPGPIQDQFCSEILRDLKANLQTTEKKAAGLAKFNPWLRLEPFQGAKEMLAALDAAEPAYVHQACQGKGCADCRDSGFLPRWRYQELQHQGMAI